MRRVYFIRPIGMEGPIKIGCSQSPDGRRETLEAWSPFPLEILAEIEGDLWLEQRFHRAFHHLHQRREWFEAAPELLAVVAAIKAGAFNTNELPEPGDIVSARWRNRRPLPDWNSKQGALTRRVRKAERLAHVRCPVDYRGAYRDQRHDDIALAEAFAANPVMFEELARGVPAPRAAA